MAAVWGGLVAIAAAILLLQLGAAQLFDEDEPKNAACAKEMLARGDWIVPTFNQQLRTDKPALLYWFMLTSYHAFGVNEFAARLPSALFGIGTVLATAWIGQRLFGRFAGFWAGLALVSSPLFAFVARAATPESTLVFCNTLAMLALAAAFFPRREEAAGSTSSAEAAADLRPGYAWIGFYAALGFSILAKGPIGILLPLVVLGAFVHLNQLRQPATPVATWRGWLLAALSPASIIRSLARMRLVTGLAIAAAIALPWYIAVAYATEGRWVLGFFGTHNVQRFLQPLENHSGPIIYYVPAILIGMFPWSVFLPAALWQGVERLKRTTERSPELFLLCWALAYILFYSCARTKLPHYVLPAFPPLALLAGALIDRWVHDRHTLSKALSRAALGGTALVGAGLAISLAMLAPQYLPGEEWLLVIGVVPLWGGAVAWIFLEKSTTSRAMSVFAASAVMLAAMLVAVAPARINRFQHSAKIVAIASEGLSQPVQLLTYHGFTPGLVFYADQPVIECHRPTEFLRTLAEHPEAVVMTLPKNIDALGDRLPPEWKIFARQKRFMKPGELVLLRRTTTVAVREPRAAEERTELK